MGYANEVYRLVNDDLITPYTFRFAIPLLHSHNLIGQKAYDMTITNILSYLEMHVNQTDMDMVSSSQRLNKYIGIIIENAIYDIFTSIDNDQYGVVNHDDLDDWILSHHDEFRYTLYTFTMSVIRYCIPELQKATKAFREMGAYVTPFQFHRSRHDPTFLEVTCYLEKTRSVLQKEI